jgi:hypothetical protein
LVSERLEKLDMEWNLKNLMVEECCKRKQTARENLLMRVMRILGTFILSPKGKEEKLKSSP